MKPPKMSRQNLHFTDLTLHGVLWPTNGRDKYWSREMALWQVWPPVEQGLESFQKAGPLTTRSNQLWQTELWDVW